MYTCITERLGLHQFVTQQQKMRCRDLNYIYTRYVHIYIYAYKLAKIACQTLQEFRYSCILNFVNHLIEANARNSHLLTKILEVRRDITIGITQMNE